MDNTSTLRRKLFTLALIVIAIGLLIYVVRYLDNAPRTDDAYVLADTINVTPEVSGRIIDLPIKDNQAVKKGDILFRIDARPYELAVAKAQASLDTLEKEIDLAQRTVNAQKLSAAAAKANIDRARAAADQAADTLNRMQPLLGKGYVAAEQIDQAQTAKRSAQAQLDTATLEAGRASAAVGDVNALLAKREIIKAEIAMAKLNLEYTSVRAPFDGRVIGLKISAGQFASAGHPVFTLANSDHWYVVANFRETDLETIKPGRKAQVYLMSDPSRHYEGTVESIGYGVFPDDGGGEVAGLPRVPRSINWVRVAQRFPVRILVSNPDANEFRIGASAVALLKTDTGTH